MPRWLSNTKFAAQASDSRRGRVRRRHRGPLGNRRRSLISRSIIEVAARIILSERSAEILTDRLEETVDVDRRRKQPIGPSGGVFDRL